MGKASYTRCAYEVLGWVLCGRHYDIYHYAATSVPNRLEDMGLITINRDEKEYTYHYNSPQAQNAYWAEYKRQKEQRDSMVKSDD